MKQAIAGVVPSELGEVTVMTVWPSIAVYTPGKILGQLYNIRAGVYIFRIGNLVALVSIPLALALYFCRILPFVGMRYKLSNQRIVVQRGLMAVDDKSIEFDRFDRIEIDVQDGQQWYNAGNLVFYHAETETFRLDGVSRPKVFREICMKSRDSYVGVQEVRERQSVRS